LRQDVPDKATKVNELGFFGSESVLSLACALESGRLNPIISINSVSYVTDQRLLYGFADLLLEILVEGIQKEWHPQG